MRARVAILIVVALVLVGCQDNSSEKARKTRAKKPTTQATATSASLTQQEVIADTEASTVRISGRIGESYVFGSGVVIDQTQGWILTNAHVVSGTSTLKVTLPDHQQVSARVLGQAPCDDIAVLELNPNPGDLPAIEMGQDEDIQQGDSVTAIGFPESYQDPFSENVSPTATTGTVSNTGISAEPDPSLPRYDSLIQHQAPVNHGNSGGPLVDAQARLIGINTLANAIGPSGEPIQGQYYAISIDAINELLPTLGSGQDIGYVGWSVLANSPDLSAQFAEAFGYAPPASDGLLALGSDPGSPASRHGFQAGDVIEAVDGSSVSTVPELCGVIESHGPGDVLTVAGVTIADDGTPISYTENIRIP
jgi:S1-C subfamily serine protease